MVYKNFYIIYASFVDLHFLLFTSARNPPKGHVVFSLIVTVWHRFSEVISVKILLDKVPKMSQKMGKSWGKSQESSLAADCRMQFWSDMALKASVRPACWSDMGLVRPGRAHAFVSAIQFIVAILSCNRSYLLYFNGSHKLPP